jgi:hypothetical protein
MLEKDRRLDIKKSLKDEELQYGIHSFEEFYKDELLLDSNREPRPVRAEDFRPKTSLEKLMDSKKVFKTVKDKETDYFKEFETYKANKSKFFIFHLISNNDVNIHFFN